MQSWSRRYVTLSRSLLTSLFLKNRARFAVTASYRLSPPIVSDESNPVLPHLATRFRDRFSPQVINVDPRIKKKLR
jgi:hypothetical protein